MRCYGRRPDGVVILATSRSCGGQDVLVGLNGIFGNNFTISVLVRGVDDWWNSKICWRERGSGG